MRRFFTPFLRKLYVAFGCFLIVYAVVTLFLRTEWHKEALYHQLLHGTRRQRVSAAFDLAYVGGEKQLLRALKSPVPEIREVAAESLWSLWFHAAGREAYRWSQQALQASQRSAYSDALAILNRTLEKYPKFAEGWNRRATLYWQMGKYRLSISDCRHVLALNPNHFGAWQGMALCQMHLGQVDEAYRSVKHALKITPYNESLRNMLERLEQMQPGSEPPPKNQVLI